MDKVVLLIRSGSAPTQQADRDRAWPVIEMAAQALPDAQLGLDGVVASRVVKPFAEDDPLLGLVEIWTDAPGTADAVQRELSTRLVDLGGAVLTSATCSEIIFRRVQDYAHAGSEYGLKLAGTAFRRDDFEPDAFFDYWTNVHAPIGGHLPGLGGYTVSRRVTGRLGEEGADAVIQQWYRDEQAFNDAQTTDIAKAAWADVANYAKTTGTAFWLMTESVVVHPPATGPGTLET